MASEIHDLVEERLELITERDEAQEEMGGLIEERREQDALALEIAMESAEAGLIDA